MFAKSKHSKHSSENSLTPDIEIINNTPSLVGGGHYAAPHALTAEEVLKQPQKPVENIPVAGANKLSPLDALRQKTMAAAAEKEKKAAEQRAAEALKAQQEAEKLHTAIPQNPIKSVQKANTSLYEKCLPYISETDGMPIKKEPDYKLASVDEIINISESKASELLKKLNLMGSVSYDSLSKQEEPKVEEILQKAEIISDGKPLETEIEIIEMKSEEADVIPTISDIDNSTSPSPTVSFDAIHTEAQYEDIVSSTRPIDLTGEFFEIDESEHHQISTEEALQPEEFKVQDDYLGYTDAKRIGTLLLKNSRSAGVRLILTFLLTAVLGVLRVPFIYEAFSAGQMFFSLISTGIFFLICLVNYDAFSAIKSLFTPRALPESGAALTAIAAAVYCAHTLSIKSSPYNMIVFASITFLVKCIAVSMRNTYILNNFRIIATKRDKFALKFISDRQITFAMAKNTIEGDALIGAANRCESVQEFLKHTYKDSVMNGIFGKFTLAALIISLIGAAVYGIYNSSVSSFFTVFAVLVGISFSPTSLFTDIYPLSRANARLNKNGAMIAGASGAASIELANAVAARSCDIFPAGTVTLHSMQSLSPNNIDRTLLDAAAVSKQIESPLFGIFGKIAATDQKEIPIADSIKYEDRLGISGWVENRHIFIGNRTLLEAHGIKVPPIEVDKKILRNGFFPIYIACDDLPCALLTVQYNVDEKICEDVRRLTSSGVMILIDSSDPNLTGEMVCDYFGLYEGAVYIMGSSGSQLYKNAVKAEDGVSSPAGFRDEPGNIFSVFKEAARIKHTITALTVFHIIAAILMTVAYVYSSFINSFSPLESGTIFLYTAASLVISYIITLLKRS